VLALSFVVALAIRRDLAQSTIAALAGAYGNIGYMGPGLALATLGAQAAAPVALVFCFETLLFFSLVPLLMAIARSAPSLTAAALEVIRKIVLHPLVIATALGVLSGAADFEPPVALDRLMQFLQSASAPCALFTLGVTVALRPFQRVLWEVPVLVLIKLVLHPALALVLLTALVMAALPPALTCSCWRGNTMPGSSRRRDRCCSARSSRSRRSPR
jgi:malonate transporter